ncbi:S8 family peptidase [Collimonas humicola]|uniref:S8 family peptidase n=1 Tax=Collimonas humicola TaxID=2825886 RepID=UPI001B8D630A|nr:S8 family peptidase [Collimonas humicola]
MKSVIVFTCIFGVLSCSTAREPADRSFATPEYLAQPGLAVVKAAALYERGGTGAGVTVAVIDSGLMPSHQEFANRLAGPGYNYIEDVARVVDDPLNHGTKMAGLIAANRDYRGMHGVAYDAKILPMQFGASCKDRCDRRTEPFESDDQIARAWTDSYAQGVRILSNSWSNALDAHLLSESHYRQLMPDSLAVAKDLTGKDVVFVFPTGNEIRREPLMEAGLPYLVEGIEKGWLAVTAVRNDGSKITDKANACGIARNWCIAAPGGDGGKGNGLLTTDRDGAYSEATATSAAVAMVAGALAALKSRFPEMTTQQLRDRLLQTANRTGVYANSDLYGQGLLDLDAASR